MRKRFVSERNVFGRQEIIFFTDLCTKWSGWNKDKILWAIDDGELNCYLLSMSGVDAMGVDRVLSEERFLCTQEIETESGYVSSCEEYFLSMFFTVNDVIGLEAKRPEVLWVQSGLRERYIWEELDDAKEEIVRLLNENENLRSKINQLNRSKGHLPQHEKRLDPRERNKYLEAFIAASCPGGNSSPLQQRGLAGTLKKRAEELGLTLSEDTSLKIIKQAVELIGTRNK